MPILTDFTLVRYEDATLTIGLSPPAPIGAWEIQFTLKNRFGGDAFVTKSVNSGFNNSSGINITDSGVGVFNVNINSVDTSGRDFGSYAFGVEKLNSGSRSTLVEGYLILTP